VIAFLLFIVVIVFIAQTFIEGNKDSKGKQTSQQ
jgi:hypothetical protein